jgi:anti-sigma factor RsiW
MTCRRVEALLSNHLEGRLTGQTAAELTVHLRDCPACRRLQAEYLSFGAALREAPRPEAPAGIEQRAVQRWLAGEGPRPFGPDASGSPAYWLAVSSLVRRPRLALAAGAAVSVLLAAVRLAPLWVSGPPALQQLAGSVVQVQHRSPQAAFHPPAQRQLESRQGTPNHGRRIGQNVEPGRQGLEGAVKVFQRLTAKKLRKKAVGWRTFR